MIDVQKMILQVMKKEIFSASSEENQAARNVLAELKTKQIDLRNNGPIDAVAQNKVLSKMRSDRENSAGIYEKAGRAEMAAEERTQAAVAAALMAMLEPELPKQLSEEEIRKIIAETVAAAPAPNMGIIMKAFKDKEVDRSLVSRIAGEFLKH